MGSGNGCVGEGSASGEDGCGCIGNGDSECCGSGFVNNGEASGSVGSGSKGEAGDSSREGGNGFVEMSSKGLESDGGSVGNGAGSGSGSTEMGGVSAEVSFHSSFTGSAAASMRKVDCSVSISPMEGSGERENSWVILGAESGSSNRAGTPARLFSIR